MTTQDFDRLLAEFERAIQDCQTLYHSSAKLCIQQCPYLLPGSPESFYQLMDDMHRGLLIKIYVTIVQADERWTSEEKRVAQKLFQHLWGELPEGSLREAANQIFRESEKLQWKTLVRPFQQFQPLRDRIAPLETLIVRIANLVAKADGQFTAGELSGLRQIQHEVEVCLRRADDGGLTGITPVPSNGSAGQQVQLQDINLEEELALAEPIESDAEQPSPEVRLAEAMKKLDGLVGLPQVKHEIHTLTNFLKMQQQRIAAGLPQTKLSLHMVFGGNPGTGKTTVARIVGEIFGAMGILSIGHLVETDRSGLVAEYAGQTGPKTNKKVDEAMDGVLFIDEAYSLVDESGDDPYGREALSTLLKRMEDSRDRLVVILAGYPEQMERLIKTNPGLSSRFNTQLTFEDYTPGELGRIFGRLCAENHYLVPSATQVRTLLGFNWLYDHRDGHFGNGRLVRNTFETAIRRLANRIAGVAKLSKEMLTTLEPDDIALLEVPRETWEDVPVEKLRFQVTCDGCGDVSSAPAEFLGRRVKCNRCQHKFIAAWGEPMEST
jgi:tellurite resistance protein